MKTLGEVSKVLSERAERRRYGKMQLAADAGVTYRTLSHVLGGEQDFKVSTLMAVADRLGLELMLVPKEARVMFQTSISVREAPERVLRDVERLSTSNLNRQVGKALPSGIVSKVQARLARARKGGA